jgi:ATP-dependent helicase/nuclease subunit B
MGPQSGEEIDNWLREGGVVLAASERAARALIFGFHERRRAEGLAAWPAPAIHTWTAFARAAWESHAGDRMLLNPAQEQTLWTSILARETHLATLLEGPRQRLAALAIDAHQLLCSWAPRYLHPAARASWDRDAAAFSRWLATFDAECTRNRVLSPARLPLELIDLLASDHAPRSPLLLVGFDRLLPLHRELFNAWGNWREVSPATPAQQVDFYSAPDEAAELAACASWCAQQLAQNPKVRLLVLTQDIAARRGAIERAFLRTARAVSAPQFEFSLGIPLAQVPLPRAAQLLLRWLKSPLLESEIDWLLSTGFAADAAESLALQAYMRALRRHGLARPEWTLEAFIAQASAVQPPPAWLSRVKQARLQYAAVASLRQGPLDWSALALELLETLGLPGPQIASAEYQAWQRWQQALDACASLGFDGCRIAWSDFLSDLARIFAETLYAPESGGAPIQIAGPAEAAGLSADAVWFLGTTEDRWPSAGPAHPLLPPYVQRENGMPHATARLDWELAQAITARVLASAPSVRFSYPRHTSDADARPSRLIVQLAGAPQLLPASLTSPPLPVPSTVPFADATRIPFPHAAVSGGASVLTAQSQCGFKAFATARLGAQSWEPAEFGLSASQRGQLLHAVLHAVWSPPPRGLRSLQDLLALTDRAAFVAAHVREAIDASLPGGIRERMPARYLELEAERLCRLANEWLAYEAQRIAFTVEQTEAPGTAHIAGLMLSLRLDRIDRLNDGSLAVIDYKTGDVSPKDWELPRPDDIQLPLYAGFALNGAPGGLLFAKLRAGESRFVGCMRNARATLLENLHGRDALTRSPLTPDQMHAWREAIEQLARDFVAGRADADPRTWPDTCNRCGLHALCRIHELRTAVDAEDTEEADE